MCVFDGAGIMDIHWLHFSKRTGWVSPDEYTLIGDVLFWSGTKGGLSRA